MIKTRFAPSPTGFLHIGSLRTALYSYLFARQKKGNFILRIEDTDQTRYVEGAVESLLKTLNWAGLEYDEGPNPTNPNEKEIGENGPYIQSKRTALYLKHVEELLQKGHAYRCFCTPERLDQMRTEQQAKHLAPMYDKKCRYCSKEETDKLLAEKTPYVIRLAIPENETLRFHDVVRGDLKFESNLIDDQVLLKSDGFPTYHLANVIDDHFMGITHVIRGEEWLPSTPKHLYLYKAFGWTPPEFAHIPLLLNKDKTKLSKRQNDVAVEDYIAKGYLKEAMINYIALLGWNPGEGSTQEIFSLDELIEKFNLENVHKSGAIFDVERLNWMNGEYLRKLTVDDFAQRLLPWLEKTEWFTGEKTLETPYAKTALKAVQTRIKTLADAAPMLHYFLNDTIDYDLQLLQSEKMKIDAVIAKTALQAARDDLNAHTDFSSEEAIKACLVKTIERLGFKNGQVLWPLRMALTGQEFSPGAFEMIQILGKEKTLDRLDQTLRILK
ncbi:MAG: glutamate--tRNA ligase [Candidatus Gracilibacteria bacterium]